MKKIAMILIIFLSIISIQSSALSNDSHNENSQIVEDKAVNSVKEILTKYNEYVLLSNRCTGSLEVDTSVLYPAERGKYSELVFYWDELVEKYPDIVKMENYSLNYDEYDLKNLIPPRYKVIDSKYKSIDDIHNLLDSIFTEKLVHLRLAADIINTSDVPYVGIYDWTFYSKFEKTGKFYDVDGELYTTWEDQNFKILTLRYIDIESINVLEVENGYVVSARGSSEYRDGKVSKPDSDVKFYFEIVGDELRISAIDFKRDHIKDNETQIGDIYDQINALYELQNDVVFNSLDYDPNTMYIMATRNSYFANPDHLKKNTSVYRFEHERFMNLADLYDWAYDVYSPLKAELFYSIYFDSGYYSPSGQTLSSGRFKNNEYGLFVEDFTKIHHYGEIITFNKHFDFDDFEMIETDNRVFFYKKDDSFWDVICFEKSYSFDNNEFELRLHSNVQCYEGFEEGFFDINEAEMKTSSDFYLYNEFYE